MVDGPPPDVTVAEASGDAGGRVAGGENLGKYRLDRVIGAGGMGIVWAAFDPDLERAVAIKLLKTGDGEPAVRSRFLREARAMARLKHPNVLTVYEVGTDRGRDYIAMELVDGESVDAWLARRPPVAAIAEVLLAAGRGLAAAHDADLVHRDFKPHNILRSRDGHVYVTDFGLARGKIEDGIELAQVAVGALPDDLVGRSRPLDSVLDSPLTQTGVLIGTPAYMAPEQFAGRIPDDRSDQFAYCVTAWEALTGQRPFRGGTLAELESAAARGPAALTSELPAPVRAVLIRGLDPAPAARWPDLHSLLAALGSALARRPRRARWPWLVGGLVALGAATTMAVVGQRSHEQRSPECASAEEVFGDAWSPERRAAMLRNHSKGDGIGSVVLMDQARRQWLSTYTSVCREPASEERSRQLTCLRLVRDELSRVASTVAAGNSRTDAAEVVSLNIAIGSCAPDSEDSPVPGLPGAPMPPLPPDLR